jgi:MFS superfamily sulfate permease-like transporter
MKRAYVFRATDYQPGDIIHIDLAQEVSFLNKTSIKSTLRQLPGGGHVVIDASQTVYMAHDVQDLIKEFRDVIAPSRDIKLKLIGFKEHYDIENFEDQNFVTIEQRYNVLRRRMEPVIKKKES